MRWPEGYLYRLGCAEVLAGWCYHCPLSHRAVEQEALQGCVWAGCVVLGSTG